MTVNFSRAISKRSGVQLNYISDQSEIGSVASDYNGGFVGQFTRGRIDKSFVVTAEKLQRQLGAARSLNVSALAETQVHIYEALRLGMQQGIVSRLIASDAVNKLLICTATITGDGKTPPVWSTGLQSAGLPASALIAFKHIECFNDGVTCEINAQAAEDDEGAPAPSKIITVRFVDPASGKVILGPYTGSLDPTAIDEFKNSLFITDVIEKGTDLLQVVEVKAGATVPVECPFYGKKNGKDVFASANLIYFTEGTKVYTSAELDAALTRLRRSRPNFTYIGSGGTENVTLLASLITMGKEINKQVIWDVPGRLDPAAAATFRESVGGAADTLYSQVYWTPSKADNALAGGKGYIGSSGQQIGLRCARNAQVNGKGIAPRNQPIAGADYGLNRTNITQTYEPEADELELLAASNINPCIFMDYPSGAKYAWIDSLTCEQTAGASKLIAVAEMATWFDGKVVDYGLEVLQKPMATSIKLMTRFLGELLPAMQSAGWLNPTAELNGAAFQAQVQRSDASPYDTMMVLSDVCYDGTNRVTNVQQTIVRQS